ncbi:hypothetical protein ARMGADRAFT_1020476, partial [Armillaria gallica]
TLTNLCGLGRSSTVVVILLPLNGFNLDDCRSLVRADAALPRQLWWRMELGELGKSMIRYCATVYDSIHNGYPEARVLHTGITVLLSHIVGGETLSSSTRASRSSRRPFNLRFPHFL